MNARNYSNLAWSLSQEMRQARARRRMDLIRKWGWPVALIAGAFLLNVFHIGGSL